MASEPIITAAMRTHPKADLRTGKLDANHGPITSRSRPRRMHTATNAKMNSNTARPIIFRASSIETIRTITAIAIKTMARVVIALSS